MSYQLPTRCPNCGATLSDLWDGEPVSAFIGEWSDDRFRCDGYVLAIGFMGPQRAKSCGYFGLEDFSEQDLLQELKRGDGMSKMAMTIVENAKVGLAGRKYLSDTGDIYANLPQYLHIGDDK